MNIEITGCRDCVFNFSYYDETREYNECALARNKGDIIFTDRNKLILNNCPIPKEGITIKPKQ